MRLTVNGRPVDADPPGETTLLDFLRDHRGLTGTKRGCDRAECGTCTVLFDGEPVYSCRTLVHRCEGRTVETIEGLGTTDAPHLLQEAFVAEDATQCGFCTPGQILAAVAVLAHHPDPSDEQIIAGLSGNLCRCGTHPKIVRAVRRAAAAMRTETHD